MATINDVMQKLTRVEGKVDTLLTRTKALVASVADLNERLTPKDDTATPLVMVRVKVEGETDGTGATVYNLLGDLASVENEKTISLTLTPQ